MVRPVVAAHRVQDRGGGLHNVVGVNQVGEVASDQRFRCQAEFVLPAARGPAHNPVEVTDAGEIARETVKPVVPDGSPGRTGTHNCIAPPVAQHPRLHSAPLQCRIGMIHCVTESA